MSWYNWYKWYSLEVKPRFLERVVPVVPLVPPHSRHPHPTAYHRRDKRDKRAGGRPMIDAPPDPPGASPAVGNSRSIKSQNESSREA